MLMTFQICLIVINILTFRERLHKENSELKETSKKQTAELRDLMEKRDEVLKM